MNRETNDKKRLVVSYQNLPVELQEELARRYPTGYTDAMIRIDKPSGGFFYAVALETENVSYLVKIDVKVDKIEEADGEDDYGEEIGGMVEMTADMADETTDEEE